ncbi:hypothetical protein ACVIHD_006346 [Bradyrhizobium embrapense]
METFDHDLVHYRCNGMIAIACQAIDTGPYQEMRSNLLGGAKQLINIGLTITDMDALRWPLEKLRGLLEVLQPPNALLGFNGDPCQVDLAPERSDPSEFLSGPELHSAEPQWKPIEGHRKARMHQYSACRVRLGFSVQSSRVAFGDAINHPD